MCAVRETVFASIGRANDRDGLVGAASAKVVYSYHAAKRQVEDGRRSVSLAQTQVIGDDHYYSGQVGLTNLEPDSIVSVPSR